MYWYVIHIFCALQVDGDAEESQVLEELERCLQREVGNKKKNGGYYVSVPKLKAASDVLDQALLKIDD